jgi:hypothetical protein
MILQPQNIRPKFIEINEKFENKHYTRLVFQWRNASLMKIFDQNSFYITTFEKNDLSSEQNFRPKNFDD